MSGTLTREGSCLCQAVTISVDKAKSDLGACHCRKCRKWSGGPFLELESGTEVSIIGSENITRYASSAWAERAFCRQCGTHLFMLDKASGEYGVSVGLFEEHQGIEFNRQVFIDQRPHYYSFSNETLNIDSDFIYEKFPHVREGRDGHQ